MDEEKKRYSTLQIIGIIVAIIAGIFIPLIAVYYNYHLTKDDNNNKKTVIINEQPSIRNPDTVIQKINVIPDNPKSNIKPDQKTELQSPPITELPSPSKKITKILLKLECSQNNGLVFTATGDLTVGEANTISGSINYTLTTVPYKFRNQTILQGHPTATELVSGNIIGSRYVFRGERILYDANGLYTLSAYEITLYSNGTLVGFCKDVNLESNYCDLIGTYKIAE